MDNITLLKKIISSGEALVKELLPEPKINYGASRIIERNKIHLKELSKWKNTAISFLSLCNLADCSFYLKEFEKAINKTTDLSGEFYKENVELAIGILKSLLFYLENKN